MNKINNLLTRFGITATLVVVYFFLPSNALALPSGFETSVVASGFNQPTTISFTQDGRIFVAEKSGTVRVIKNGVLLPAPLISLSDVNSYGDRGLIGMAVDPNFAQNGYLYLSYTYENTPGTSFSGIKTGRIVRVTVVGDTADENTKVVLVGTVTGNATTPSCDNYAVTSDCIPSDAPSHTVGGLRFGPDGKLYAATGDGAHFDYADVRSLRAQNLDSLAGKVLRLNTDGTAPTDNPFYNGNPNANRSKVYAYGFRNMFRFNFRPSTGALYGGDVGWSSYEELNKVVSGGNYGWPCKEGAVVTPNGLGCNAPGAIDPIYVYAHDGNGAGSVTAGSFPTGNAYPSSYLSTMFFGDYAQNWIKTMTVSGTDTNPVIANFGDAVDGTNGPVEFVTGPEGNVYFISIYTGELKKITHTSGNRQPIVNISASPTSGNAPLTVNFSSVGTSDPDGNPITYLWNFGNNATSSLANPNYVYSSNGVYNATLTVFDNQGGQTTKSIKITVGNQAPTAQITSPVNGSLYNVDQVLTLTGVGTDPESGTLPAGNLSWRVILHHNVHIHILEQHTGNNISFTAPDHGDPDVYTEIELTVTDAAGLTDTTSTYIYLNNAGNGNGGNLIDNNSFETTDPQNPSSPANWAQDWWGVNSQTFTYPVTGYEGTQMRGARVQVNSYTSGDAKWAHAHVQVLPNTQYTFSNYYTSNVVSTLVAEVVLTNGAYAYINLGTVPAATNFTKVTRTFTTPANARFVTVYHLLERVGILTTDNYSLVIGNGTPTDTTAPIVSITSPLNSATVSGTININATSTDNVAVAGVKFLVDGVIRGVEDTTSPYSVSWNTASSTNGSHTLTAVARDTSGNLATSTNIVVTVNNSAAPGPNLVTNGTFEAGTTLPTGWTKGGWGTNTRTLTYPVSGASSTKAVRVEITSHTSGDAKWVHTKIPVTPGKQYQYKDKYRSNVISDVIGEYTLSNGSLSYFGLQKELVPSTNWTQVTGTFNPPANATKVTFYHLISSVGWVEIDDVEVTELGSGTPGETVPPVVQFLTPTNNSTVSGVVNITASSSDNVAVTYVFYAVDGNPITGQLTSAPYLFAWDTNTVSNGPHLIKATTHDPSGNNSTSTITVIVNNSTSTPDTTSPLVSLTSPTASSTVSGLVNITASSSDNVAVSGVKFLVDGVQIGVEDTTSPYSVSWNTASTTNGNKTLNAVSRDSSGNIATSTGVIVNVSNSVATTGPNLISNPSVETANGTKPLNWNNGKWGTNTTTFTYPTAGQDGTKGIGINISTYTNGDAKWFFNDVTVVPGATYTFSEYYKSNVVTNVTVRWTSSTGVLTYQSLGNPAIATNWTLRTNTITVPANVTKMTVFHLIKAVGTLEVDNYSLTLGTSTPDTTSPLVSLTSPTASSTVSGLVNITASSSDNVAVSGVKFLVDGVQIGVEDTTSPYSVSWNTASTTNGNKTLNAVSRDSSGNIATSTGVIVNVSNSVADTIPPFIEFENVLNNDNLSGDFHIHINATDNVQISNIQLKLDDIVLTNLPENTHYHFDLDTTLYTNGSHTLSAIVTDTSSNTSSTTVNININNVVIDTNPPVTTITNPSNNSTASGNLNIGVTAIDNVAVSAVHILVDGINVVTDNTFPYEATIDTTVYLNGPHTITAYSEDTSNNIGNATPITININNAPVTPPALNLVLNPSLETIDTGDTSKPENWFKGGWGTNNAVFTYPTTGNHLAKAGKIEITSYTDGDAKWFFNDVAVVEGETYTFKSEYKSDVPTVLTARFGYPNGSVQYRDIANLGVANVWTNTSNDILIPPGANKMTIFHVINSVGVLEVDNYFLSATIPAGNQFTNGLVSLTFDDGWISHYTDALPILNGTNLKAGFYIISQETLEAVPNNRIDNPNLEIVSGSSTTTPLNWNIEVNGTNNAVFTYPVTGQSGLGAKVEITSHTSGDAKWVFADATAISNQEYKMSFYYRNNVDTPVIGRFTLNDNSTFILNLGTATTSTGWVKFERNFYVPVNLKSLSFYTSLDKVGFVEVDTFDLNRVPVFLSPTQVQAMKNAGHEIGSHTQTHPYLTTLTPGNLVSEVSGSKTDLSNTMGISGINTFVYPYGDYDANVRQAVVNAGYMGARSVDRGMNYRDTDKFTLKIQQVDRTTNMAQFQSWIDEARNNRAWLILMFHQVNNDPAADLGVTPALFQQMVDTLVAQQVTVVTMEQGLGLMNP